ncbi:MAG: family 16 glycosylhydrolase [Candidatus Azobacteroides sp.]|nr:family 16 glycosylhydrolase [Candidatus Azobacteroides sp.]
MKNAIATLLLGCFFLFSTKAQDTNILIDDFESGDKGWAPVDAGWVDFQIVDNPLVDAVNSSAKVLKITRHTGTQTYAGVILRDKISLTFGTLPGMYRFGKVKFLKPKAGEVTLKLELNGDNGSFSSSAQYTAMNAWQEVTFDLGGATGTVYDDFFIQPAKDADLTADVTVYIDDISFEIDPDAQPVPDPELPGTFQLVWADEFNGNSYDTNIWSPQIAGDGFGNNELQYYTGNANNIFTRDGCLVIKAVKEQYQNRDYTSGKLWSQNKKYFKYGRVEARFKLPKGVGTWPAIWMMPQSSVYGGWPRSGEIDVMEFVGYQPNTIFGTVHYGNPNHQQSGSSLTVSDPDAFHIIRIDWEPGYIKWYLDDRLLYTYNNGYAGSAQWPFDQNFYVILNFAVGGNWGGAQGVDTSIWPQEFLIDYVRVYQKVEESGIKEASDKTFSMEQPTGNTLRLTLASSPSTIEIFTVSGSKLLHLQSVAKEETIDISSYPKGIYIIRVTGDKTGRSDKFIKK